MFERWQPHKSFHGRADLQLRVLHESIQFHPNGTLKTDLYFTLKHSQGQEQRNKRTEVE